VATCGSNTVSLAGWWLVAASGARQLPQPSLSLHPSQGVSLGDNVTLRCHVPRSPSRVYLYRDNSPRPYRSADTERGTIDFSLVNINSDDAVKYQCQYEISGSGQTSEKSDPVELVAIGEGSGDGDWPWAVPTGSRP
ncbi:LRB3B protein, partial [Odontophorus gujanensis]|nr:LRB3B protein [Odontophorus gujanensis]